MEDSIDWRIALIGVNTVVLVEVLILVQMFLIVLNREVLC